jgi:voltage-gated potassium channel
MQRKALADGRSSSALTVLLPVLLALWLATSLCYWTLEHNINPDARTFGDALYWAFLTMTTMGYGSAASLHAETRVLAGIVIFVGIGLVSLVSGHIAAKLLHDDDGAEVRAELHDIREELHQLRITLQAREETQLEAAGPW